IGEKPCVCVYHSLSVVSESLLLVEYFLLFISLSICRQRRDEQLADSEKLAETHAESSVKVSVLVEMCQRW
uniref:Uncharacterized protein n=1 Tax=Sinocyclocheilus anshuiensis TaxID=1608454 RepID=A0A671PV44_9TELE